ncbi:MAG TPA: YceI family protein [Thermoanaerobaculia bacterium]|jgi:polyisoprenoid-binding protein YceI|nr:YceI family protein [Thermoanaerobaculia bacterium]
MLRAVAAAAFFAAAAALPAAEYALDVDHSNVQFSVPMLAVSKVTGKFMRYDVKMSAGKARDLSQAKVTAVIETSSIATGSDSWDGKLRTPAFFDVQKYPEIRFESRRVRKVKGKWEAVGNLSIHGVTHEITLPFEIKGRFEGPHPDDRIGIQATFSFDRREFGMAWDNNPEAKVVGNKVTVDISLLATRIAGKK